jgi:uncharacterized protein YkwD
MIFTPSMIALLALAQVDFSLNSEDAMEEVFLSGTGGGVQCEDCPFTIALTPSEIEQTKQEVFAIVNKERAIQGVAPLCLNKELGSAAQLHSLDQKSCGKMSHTGCNGSSMGQRVRASGYLSRGAGENVAWGQRSAKSVMNSWMNSDGHRRNILFSSYKNIGIGLSDNFYWTQVFGAPASGDGCNVNAGTTPAPTPEVPTPAPLPTPAPTPVPAPEPFPDCKTVSGPDSGGKIDQNCLFPFTYNGVKYTKCTSVNDLDSKLWCSVATDSSGNHLRGNWGYCGDLCPGITTPPSPTTAPTVAMTLNPSPKPTKNPTPLPTPGSSPAPSPPLVTPVPTPNGSGGGGGCVWNLEKPGAYCYGAWNINRKIVTAAGDPQKKLAWSQCKELVESDSECGDQAYGPDDSVGATGVCRCVLKGKQCLSVPSKSGNNVYKRTCPEVDNPCIGAESVSQELVAARTELAGLQAKVATLEVQISAASVRR